MERIAAVLARIGGVDVTLTGELPDTLRGVRMRDGTGRGMLNRGHADPLVDAVLRQEQAEELVQAVDRIRSVRAPSPKDIYLLTSAVIDLTVDELVTLDELAGTKLEMLLERFGGLAPLAESWLVERAPDLFPSAKGGQKLETQRPGGPLG